jgi:alkanesulfonate monooxygenase SsuD/methylene tetrahydromethanopterin reductase-like flavin-dependent oxidoreductase (luciferase family)
VTAGRLCVRYDLRAPAFGAPASTLYPAMLDQVAWADDRFRPDAVVVSEHHASPDGYCPAPLEVAAAVAARTTHAQVQVAALVLPLHDPVRLAEGSAVVDLLSGGRLELVVVAGYRPSEYALFERALAGRGAQVEAAVELLHACWRGEPIERGGERFVVTPQPSGAGRPRLLFGGVSEGQALRAARLGDGFIPAGGRIDLLEAYDAERRRLGLPPGLRGGGPAPLAVHVAHDVDAAWRELAPHVLHDATSYRTWAAEGRGEPVPTPPTLAELHEIGLYRVVTPDEAVALWHELPETAVFFLHPLVGGLDPAASWRSLELFAAEVAPHLGRPAVGVP